MEKETKSNIWLWVLLAIVVIIVLYFVFFRKTAEEKNQVNTQDVNSGGENVTVPFTPPATSDSGAQNLLSAEDNLLLKGMSLATNTKILTKQVPITFTSDLKNFLSLGQNVCFRDKLTTGEVVDNFTAFTTKLDGASGYMSFAVSGLGDPNNYAVMNGAYYDKSWTYLGYPNTSFNIRTCKASVNTEYQGVKLKDMMFSLSHTTNNGDVYVLKCTYYKTSTGVYYPANFTKDFYLCVSGGIVPQLKLVNRQQTQQAVNAAS